MYADHQPQAVNETRKHERFRDFPDKEAVERQDLWPRAARYSREVPQPGRKPADFGGLRWTDNKS